MLKEIFNIFLGLLFVFSVLEFFIGLILAIISFIARPPKL